MSAGIQQLFQEHRAELLRYLRAHGAGSDAEDILHELWLKLAAANSGPIAAPRNYLFRAATNLMIDRRRSELQAQRREVDWAEAVDRLPDAAAPDPGAERALDGRRRLNLVAAELRKLPARTQAIFRDHRLGGLPQREIAASMGVSISTVESDLRTVYRLLDEIRRKLDGEAR